MSDTKYWQSFGELNDPEAYKKQTENEFKEELPFEDADGKGWLDAKAPRRDFLKYLGFSTAAATLAASCKQPVKHAIPFANKPENITPGVSKYYATTFVQDGDVVPVLAKVRDGRPIKIEGNTDAFTKGGTSAKVQASVLDLYNTHRLRYPSHKTGSKNEEIPFEQLDKAITEALAGQAVALVTGTITSPTSKAIIDAFVAKFPGSRHVQADADSHSGMLLANEASGFGRKLPSYHFENAKVIVSLGADFLGTWLSPVEFAKGYSKGRKIDEKNPDALSKHIQFDTYMSLTGASADERFTHRPSETAAVVLALAAAVGVAGVSAPALSEKLKKGVEMAAAALKANAGKALVVSGSNDVNVQVIVNAINNAVGAYGTTVNWGTPVNYRQGVDADLQSLITEIEGGKYGAVLVYGANPVYESPLGEAFAKALAKVKTSVSFNAYLDETTELCTYAVPSHHYLESWGDAEAKAGYTSFIQPTIYPLFKTRYYQTSLLKWSGDARDYEVYFKEYWKGRFGTEEAFNAALQLGVVEPAAPVVGAGSYNGGGVAAAATALSSAKKGGKYELVLYQNVGIGTGKQSGNPWLQELPDPITKATWDNYAMVSVSLAKALFGIDVINGGEKEKNDYLYFPTKPMITIKAGGKTVELPVMIIPGMQADTIAVALGYGRNATMGKAADKIGQKVSHLATFNGTTVDNFVTDVTLEKTGKDYKIAQMQISLGYDSRKEVVKETTLAAFKKHPNQYKEFRDELVEDYAPKTGEFDAESTLYPDPKSRTFGIKWGMNIDMNSCTSCHACVVSCHAENNVPVVGKSEVMRYHDMHWLRIDRYFVSDEKNPDDVKAVVFQPMMCQHCDNAPCENVCPVAATNHSQEGINQMTYNRCIGTRYCANNCPYKVRRFNWADYTGADSFPNNQDQQIVGKLDPVVFQMNDDLTRMVLNPDVTVRSRGVIEKCSFCIQRIQEKKLDAKKEGRELGGNDVKTACQTACPTDAIVFGNVSDPESAIAKTRHENPLRIFSVLEQIHTLPNVTYLAKVRNSDSEPDYMIEEHHAAAEAGKEGHGKDGEHKAEEKKAEPAH